MLAVSTSIRISLTPAETLALGGLDEGISRTCAQPRTPISASASRHLCRAHLPCVGADGNIGGPRCELALGYAELCFEPEVFFGAHSDARMSGKTTIAIIKLNARRTVLGFAQQVDVRLSTPAATSGSPANCCDGHCVLVTNGEVFQRIDIDELHLAAVG